MLKMVLVAMMLMVTIVPCAAVPLSSLYDTQQDQASTNINFKFAHLLSRPDTCELPYAEPLMRPSNEPLFLNDPSVFTSALGTKDVMEVLIAQGLTYLPKLLTAAGMTVAVKTQYITLFAPTDGAIAALGDDMLDQLLMPENSKMLHNILLYHVLNGTFTSTNLFATPSSSRKTLEGESVSLAVNPFPTVDGNSVLKADIPAINGFVHVVDHILIPPLYRNMSVLQLLANDGFSQFVQLIALAGLNSTFLPPHQVTVFAPNDAAWSALSADLRQSIVTNPILLQEFVLNHVTNGQVLSSRFTDGQTLVSFLGSSLSLTLRNLNWRVNNVLIRRYDRIAGNGVYHEIDQYLNPLTVYNLPELVRLNGLTTLYNALMNSGAQTGLESTGPFTLFAPSESAFAAAKLNITSNEQLENILFYHVVGGAINLNNLTLPTTLKTELAGSYLNVTSANGTMFTLNGKALVVTGPIKAANGLLYIINAVLVPSDIQPVSIPTTLDRLGLTKLAAAIQAAGLTDALSQPGLTLFAPSDAAFTALGASGFNVSSLYDPMNVNLLRRILSYHVAAGAYTVTELNMPSSSSLPSLVQGANLNITSRGDGNYPLVNGNKLAIANIPAINGWIHVIDKVLMPPSAATVTTRTMFEDDPELNSFFSLVSAAGADYLLSTQNKRTFFVPSAAALASLRVDDSQLINIIQYHMTSGIHWSRSLRPPVRSVVSVQGSSLELSLDISLAVRVNGATVIRPDIKTPWGVIHVINQVLYPPDLYPPTVVEAMASRGVSSFLDLVKEAEVASILRLPGPFTILAPSNEAISQMDDQILMEIRKNKDNLRRFVLNHVISHSYLVEKLPRTVVSDSGENFQVERAGDRVHIVHQLVDGTQIQSEIVGRNLIAMNGYVHIIKKEMIPVDLLPKTLISIIQSNPILSNFSSLLTSSGISNFVFKGAGEKFTIFAPTNKAVKEAMVTYKSLFSTNEVVAMIVQYHIAVGMFHTEMLSSGLRVVTTTRSDFITIHLKDGAKMLNGEARLMTSNIYANSVNDGGVVHIIDKMLIPQSVLNLKK